MSFADKEYSVYVVLTGPHSAKPWSWHIWKEIHGLLEPFAAVSRGRAAIRTTQVNALLDKKVSFGRLAWDEKSYVKWVHGSPVTESNCEKWTFLNAEAWAPSWTVCEREKQAPDFYLSVNNDHPYGESEKSKFGAVLIAALSLSERLERIDQFERAIKEIGTLVNSPLIVHKRRKWGIALSSDCFTSALMDIGVVGLFKKGPPHQRPLDLSTFEEQWDIFERTDA